MLLRNRVLARLLLLDRPVTWRPEAEVTADAERDYRWNFAANLGDGMAFFFGIAFVSSTTIVPLFVSKITLNPMAFGLIAMVAQAGWFLPQVFTAGIIERLDRKKPVVINLGFFTERLPTWLWPVAALLALHYPYPALALFIVAFAWHALGAGMVGPAWQDLFARCFPVRKRGWLFGLTTFVGTGAAALGAQYSGRVLETHPYPYNFALLFTIAAAAITLSWVSLAFVREPLQEVPDKDLARRPSVWPMMRDTLDADVNFRTYLGARMLLALGTMGTGFITVVAVERWAIADAAVGTYTAILLVGQTVGNLAAGLIADRQGHKLPLLLGAGAQVATFVVAWLAPSAAAMPFVYALLGVSMGVTYVSGTLIALEFSAPERRPTYVGIANTAVGVASAIAPLLGGWIALLGYTWLFGLSAVAGAGALVWLLVAFGDPRHVGVSVQRAEVA